MNDRMQRQLWLGPQANSGLASPAVRIRPAAMAEMPNGSVHPELTVRDSLVAMLHVAAEIEHALMIQYLFAAYSIQTDVPIPNHPEGKTTRSWREAILQTAREEMGHLLTVQNALVLLGGALHLDRDNFPNRSQFYPFEFELERLSIDSLSRYIAAEMPDETVIPAAVLSSAQLAAIRTASGGAVNRVGLLFEAIARAIPNLEPQSDLSPEDQPWQADGTHWHADFVRPTDLPIPPSVSKGVLASQMLTKKDLARVLRFVAAQGESPDQMVPDSHFARFAEIYRDWSDALTHDHTFDPTFSVLKNPNTTLPPDPSDVLTPEEQAREHRLAASRISDEKTSLWAHLFNLRYRLVLVALQHSMVLGPTPRPSGAPPFTLVRDLLVEWAFQEMTFAAGSLRDIASLLAKLPSGVNGRTAGAPFELPYTLQLPERGRARWRIYSDIFSVSLHIIERLKALAPSADEQTYLEAIQKRDSVERQQLLNEVRELDV